MFGTHLNPSTLIRKQWIAKEFVESDLLFIGRRDADFVDGYRPHIMEMKTLVDIIASGLEFTDLNDTPDALGSPGQILEVDPTGEFLQFVDPLSTFLELTDTPADYTGFADAIVTVNPTEDGLIFVPPTPKEVRYEARVNFDASNAPVESQNLINDLGVTVTWSRTGVGQYRATFNSAVDATKLIAWILPSATGSFNIASYTANHINFVHTLFVGGLGDATQSDISVEIKLYP